MNEPVRIEEASIPAALEEKIIERLRTVFDPEIPVNIYDLGLIYKLDCKPAEPAPDNKEIKYDLSIDMTLTTPNCPVAGQMPAMAKHAVEGLPELNKVDIQLVWDPPWDKSRMSDEAKLQLNFF